MSAAMSSTGRPTHGLTKPKSSAASATPVSPSASSMYTVGQGRALHVRRRILAHQQRERGRHISGARPQPDPVVVNTQRRGVVAHMLDHGMGVCHRVLIGVGHRHHTRHGYQSCPGHVRPHVLQRAFERAPRANVRKASHEHDRRRSRAAVRVRRVVDVHGENAHIGVSIFVVSQNPDSIGGWHRVNNTCLRDIVRRGMSHVQLSCVAHEGRGDSRQGLVPGNAKSRRAHATTAYQSAL